MEDINNIFTFICKCGDVSHQIIFRIYKDYEDVEVYAEIHLNPLPWYKRIVHGIKYIFGYKSKYGDFEELMFDENSAYNLQRIVDVLRLSKDSNSNDCESNDKAKILANEISKKLQYDILNVVKEEFSKHSNEIQCKKAGYYKTNI